MKNFARLAAVTVLWLSLSAAHAQFRVPLAELVDVPVSLGVAKPVAIAQVRAAIIAAALAGEWDVEPVGEDTVRLKALRDFDNRLELVVKYSSAAYSIRYVRSENLGERRTNSLPPLPGGPAELEEIRQWRKTRAGVLPEFKYSQDKEAYMIHPVYEQWLYELSSGIRRHLFVTGLGT
ncbi:MAG: hypothetical protein ABI605_11000 [Rhizobacter sp.]